MTTHKRHFGVGASFGRDLGEGSCHDMLAERLGAESHNHCQDGRGNDFMITEAMLWMARQKDLRGVTASVGVSNPYRHDMVSHLDDSEAGSRWGRWRADHKQGALALRRMAKDDRSRPWNIRLTYHVRYLTQILSLQNLFGSHGVPYIMWQVQRPRKGEYDTSAQAQIRMLERQVDTRHFYRMDHTQLDFVNETQQWTDPTPLERPWTMGHATVGVRDEHPTRQCNQQWTDRLWQYHLENNSLSQVD